MHYLGLTVHWLGSLTGSLTLSIAYGVDIKSESDKFYSASEDAMIGVVRALLPGAFSVDVFPIRADSSRKNPSQMILRCLLAQSNTSRNGFLELVSRRLRGRQGRTLMIPSSLRSSMLKNHLRFVNIPYHPLSGCLIRTTFRRGPLPPHRSWGHVWRNYPNSLTRESMKE